jgi:tetratricopeptide (TPR) repeat protein
MGEPKMIRFLLILLGASLLPAAAHAARDDADDGQSAPSEIQQLIAELGSDEDPVRRRAEEQLIRLGPEAFDELKAAEDHDDDEIAERVRYIIQQMRIPWTGPDDPPEVRRLLTRFADLSVAERADRIAELAALPDAAGLGPLCRVARYDHSPLAARRAAMAMLKLDLSAEVRKAASATCLEELGASDRPPAHWIRLYLEELADPQGTIAAWAEAAAAEAALFQATPGDTDFYTVRDLLIRHMERCNELEMGDELSAALIAVVELTVDEDHPEMLVDGMAWGLNWVIKHEAWGALAPFENRFKDAFAQNRKALYYLAAAIRRSGGAGRANVLAKKAFELEADDEDERVALAGEIASLGCVDWAEMEYRRSIEEYPLIDMRSMEARSDLAVWLHDREEYQAAADLLGEFCDAIDADAPAKQRLVEDLNDDGSSGRELLAGIAARREFYLACVAETQQDYDQQRAHLEVAAANYDKDPDILIAMYRVPGSDEDFQRRTRVRIRRAGQYVQTLIDEYPEIPTFYNQWAWLVANTEGDQELAVEYSKKSLELSPEEPSYLDTLGRCYYAVGDLENAVKFQRQAVALAPHYRVMQRQLELFEAALAAHEAQPPQDE